MESFTTWLNEELERRGWSRSEAARRGEVSDSMWAKVIGGFAQPGPDFLDGVAKAFGITRREVYARAGRIEPEPSSDTPSAKDLLTYFSTLMPEHQQSVIQHAKALYALERAEKPYQTADLDSNA